MDKTRIKNHFEQIAEQYDHWKTKNYYYYDTLKRFYRTYCGENDKVVEFGCGTGSILAAVPGCEKVGLDISEQMIERARAAHPHYIPCP